MVFKYIIPLAALGFLTSCAEFDAGFVKFQAGADKVEIRVAAACTDVLPLAKIASLIPGIPASIAAYVILGCDTVVGIEKLKANPESIIWLEDMKGKLETVLHKE